MDRKLTGFLRVCALAGMVAGLTQPAQAVTLSEAVEAGLAQSQSLMAARQSFIIARQGLVTAGSGQDTGVSLSVSGNKTMTDSATVAGGFKGSSAVSGSVTLSKRLYDFGESEAKRELASHGLAASAASYQRERQITILQLISASLDLVIKERQLNLRQDNRNRLQAQTEAASIRLEAGTSTPTVVAQAEARLARAEAELIAADSELRQAEQAFSSLTGLPAVNMQMPDLPVGLPASLGDAEAMAEMSHPSVIAALAGERSALAQFDVLTGTVGPKVNFSLSASVQDRTGRAQDKEELSAGLTLTSPLLVTPSTRAKSVEAVANLNKARHQLAEARRKARLDAGNAWRNWQSATAQLAAVDSELRAAQLVVEGTEAEIEFGLKTFLEGLDADNVLSDARLRDLQTRQAILLRAYQLQETVGALTPASLGISNGDDLDNLADPEPFFAGMLPFGEKKR